MKRFIDTLFCVIWAVAVIAQTAAMCCMAFTRNTLLDYIVGVAFVVNVVCCTINAIEDNRNSDDNDLCDEIVNK